MTAKPIFLPEALKSWEPGVAENVVRSIGCLVLAYAVFEWLCLGIHYTVIVQSDIYSISPIIRVPTGRAEPTYHLILIQLSQGS